MRRPLLAPFLLACAHAAPPPPRAAEPPPPPARVEPAPTPVAPPPPSLELEPVSAADAARWRLTNRTQETLRVGLAERARYYARDCGGPLERRGEDGQWRCMPARIEAALPALALLPPGGSVSITVSLDFSSRGPEPVLPAGTYRWRITSERVREGGAGPTASARFRLEGLSDEEALALARRVAFATEHNCGRSSEVAQRALAWTAPAATALASLGASGSPSLRARYGRFVARLPEAHERLRASLAGQPWEAAVASDVLLSSEVAAPASLREEAQLALPRALSASGYDPVLVRAVAGSDARASVLDAVTRRVRVREAPELSAWAMGLHCLRGRIGEELHLAELAFALRERARERGVEAVLATALRERAEAFEQQLRERREALDFALRVARRGRPPQEGPGMLRGCGVGFANTSEHAACATATFAPEDPALRFLTLPMTLRLEAEEPAGATSGD